MKTQRLLLVLAIVLSASYSYSRKPVKVEVKMENGKYVLLRGGKPYYIKGAGGYEKYEILASCGGNSVRTWESESIDWVLTQAEKYGLSVMVGITMGRERQGFDYDDKEAVKKQYYQIRTLIRKYRNHPSVLMWSLGNEVEHYATNPKVWDAMNELAKMIHHEDPDHPVTTTVAGVPALHMKDIISRCPDLDILSFNAFAELPWLPEKIREYGWHKPYIITEWGASGYWEVDNTSWKAGIEENSTQKANAIWERFHKGIKRDSSNCLGSYVFYWGHRQERTHTFLSFFMDTGEKTAPVDVLQYIWSGTWPENLCPVVDSMLIDKLSAKANITLDPGSTHRAEIYAWDKNKDILGYRWEILKESEEKKVGGACHQD